MHRIPAILRYEDVFAQACRLLKHELIRESQILGEVGPPPRLFGLAEGNDYARRSLRWCEMVSVNFKTVLLRLTSKDRMLIKHQHRAVWTSLAVFSTRRQSGDAATDNNGVRMLPGVARRTQRSVEFLVPDARMCGIDDLVSVAVRARVVTDSARSCPISAQAGHWCRNRLRLSRAYCCGRSHFH